MQQNICSPAKDIKTFTLTDSYACGVTKSAKECQSIHESSMFMNITGFYNIKLFLHYSKSVSHETSKCLDFASVQVKPLLQKMTFSLIQNRMRIIKMSLIWHNSILRPSKNIKLVSHCSKSVSCKNSKCLDFASVQVKRMVQNRAFFLSYQTECKNESYLTLNGIPKAFKISN